MSGNFQYGRGSAEGFTARPPISAHQAGYLARRGNPAAKDGFHAGRPSETVRKAREEGERAAAATAALEESLVFNDAGLPVKKTELEGVHAGSEAMGVKEARARAAVKSKVPEVIKDFLQSAKFNGTKPYITKPGVDAKANSVVLRGYGAEGELYILQEPSKTGAYKMKVVSDIDNLKAGKELEIAAVDLQNLLAKNPSALSLLGL